jgi:hypothetical protein
LSSALPSTLVAREGAWERRCGLPYVGGMATEIIEQELTGPWEGFLAEPAAGSGDAGVLVLSGSSGRIERERCRLFARAGVTAVSVRWFGGPR